MCYTENENQNDCGGAFLHRLRVEPLLSQGHCRCTLVCICQVVVICLVCYKANVESFAFEV